MNLCKKWSLKVWWFQKKKATNPFWKQNVVTFFRFLRCECDLDASPCNGKCMSGFVVNTMLIEQVLVVVLCNILGCVARGCEYLFLL